MNNNDFLTGPKSLDKQQIAGDNNEIVLGLSDGDDDVGDGSSLINLEKLHDIPMP